MWYFATASCNLYENLNVMYIKTSYCVQVENVQFLYKGCHNVICTQVIVITLYE